MKRLAWVTLTLIAGAAACSKGARDRGTAPPDVDAMWAMAPAKADAGMVVSGRALALAEGALIRFEELGRASPELGALVGQLEQTLGAALPGGRVARWSDLGMAGDRGFAIFHLPGGAALLVTPVVDRAKFVAVTGARADQDGDHVGADVCRSIGGRYLCTDDPALLDAARAEPAGRRAMKLHGDVEVWVARSLFEKSPAVELTGDLEAAAMVAPGRITARVHVPARGPAIDALAKMDRIKAPGAADAAGIFVADLAPALAQLPRGRGAFGISDALRALGGSITVTAPPGTMDLDARVALRDADAIGQVLARCDRFAPDGSGITATPTADGCRVHVDLPQAPPGFDFDAWIDGDTLRASRDRATPPKAAADVPPTEIGRELGDGSWTTVAWGRGAMTRSLSLPGAPTAVYQTPFFALAELGLGVRAGDDGVDGLVHVRTIWDNPDAVIAALAPVIAKAARGEDIAPDVSAIAAKFPDSPYAADVRAGPAGLMVPTALVGMLAAIAIPTFLQYEQGGRRSEAEVALAQLGKHAKRYYIEHASFPIGHEDPTPRASCCEQPGHVCAADPRDWRVAEPGHPWADLELDPIEGRFQYDYEGTAEAFTAHAVADLDCDLAGTTTYTITGTVENGAPRVHVSGPVGDD
jgi:hypothetical protein